jgi:hypothetical protein
LAPGSRWETTRWHPFPKPGKPETKGFAAQAQRRRLSLSGSAEGRRHSKVNFLYPLRFFAILQIPGSRYDKRQSCFIAFDAGLRQRALALDPGGQQVAGF